MIGSLDGRPALDVLQEVIGAERSVLVGIPVPGSDTGDYTARNLVGIDPKNKLIAIGDLAEPGMEIIFCRRDTQAARQDLERITGELKSQVDNPRGALYFVPRARRAHVRRAVRNWSSSGARSGSAAGRILLQRRDFARPVVWLHRCADRIPLRRAMPKAIRYHKQGGPEVLQLDEITVGDPGAGQVRVRHKAIGVNFVDTYQRSGLYPMQLPGVANEGAGVVDAVGQGVTNLKAGDRVTYTGLPGSYTEVRLLPAER